MSTLLSNHKQIKDFFSHKVHGIYWKEQYYFVTLGSKAFIANDMGTNTHRYSTIEF